MSWIGKYFVTELRRCANCQMLFRVPTDKEEDNSSFYEEQYTQGFTTELPTPEKLEELKRTMFAGGEKDYSYYIRLLNGLGVTSGSKIFDFGCSWGYGTYQFGQAGLDATAFEIGVSRRKYAERELGVRLVLDMDAAIANPAHKEGYDCFFSSMFWSTFHLQVKYSDTRNNC